MQPDAGIYAQDLAQRMKKAVRWGRSSARRFPAEGHRIGLYVAWHLGQPWYGDIPAWQQAYKRSGAKYTIAIPGSSLDEKLLADPAFRDVSDSLDRVTLRVFEILPGSRSAFSFSGGVRPFIFLAP